MKKVAVGFRVHSGWSALVALTLEKGEPVILDRQRLQLVEIFDYQFRQPYHTAEKMPRDKAREFIAQVKKVAKNLACQELRRLHQESAKNGCELTACGLLLASGRELPGLDKILASHPLIHTADGELFREALAEASKKCGIAVLRVKEKELVGRAAESVGQREAVLRKRIAELGRVVGTPWSQDEKYATLVAWLALSKGAGRRAQTN